MNRQRGFSLLEIVVAMGVMSIGLSGICALLIATAAGTSTVSRHAAAAWLAARLQAEWALTPDATMDDYSDAAPGAGCADDIPCTPSIFAAQNYAEWRSAVEHTLPSGNGMVCSDATPNDGQLGDPACDDTGDQVIKVFWQGIGSAPAESSRFTSALRP